MSLFQLLDCYYEAYQHVTDRDELRALAETITQVMHRRPRFDFEASYFIRAYRTECSIVQLEATLVKSILDKQVRHCHRRKMDRYLIVNAQSTMEVISGRRLVMVMVIMMMMTMRFVYIIHVHTLSSLDRSVYLGSVLHIS